MYLLHVGMTAMCPHAASVQATPSQVRVKLGGQIAHVQSDMGMVSGCPWQIPGAPPVPDPCLKVQWLMGSLRIKMGGQPALLKSNPSLCTSVTQIPAGPAQITVTQVRVKGQ